LGYSITNLLAKIPGTFLKHLPCIFPRYYLRKFLAIFSRTVEYFIPMANKGPRGDNNHQLEGMVKKVRPARPQPF
jgi:hypothetical protein